MPPDDTAPKDRGASRNKRTRKTRKPTPFIAVVTGGREFTEEKRDRARLRRHLEGAVLVFDGGARGFDGFAREVAKAAKLSRCTVPALWSLQKSSAGPRRNARMLTFAQLTAEELGLPLRLISGPGGKGTKNMRRLAEQRGVEVRHLRDPQWDGGR